MNAKHLGTTRWAILLSATISATVLFADLGPADIALSRAAWAEEPAANPPLSKQDVNRLLTQARQAIRDGKFDRAEVLVRQAEDSGVRYSLLHIGPTPSSLRRELESAKKKANSPTKPSLLARSLGAISPIPKKAAEDEVANVDPFQKRDVQLPESPTTQPIPPNDPLINSPSQNWNPPESASDNHLPSLGQIVDNPFAASQSDPTAGNPLRGDNFVQRAAAPKRLPLQVAAEAAEIKMNRLPPRAPLPSDSEVVPATYVAPNSEREAPLPPNPEDRKTLAVDAMQQARQSLAQNDIEQAERFAQQASALNIPESHFLPGEDRPSQLAWDLRNARREQSAPLPAGSTVPEQAASNEPAEFSEQLNQLPPSSKPLGSELRVAQAPTPPQSFDSNRNSSFAEELNPPTDDLAGELLREGEAALRRSDRGAALELFKQAHELREELEIPAQQRLEAHLQMLSAEPRGGNLEPPTRPSGVANTLIDAADSDQQVLARQLSSDVGRRQSEAHDLRAKEPQKALDLLRETRQMIVDSELAKEYQTQLLRRIDLTVAETEQYIKDHRAELELDAQNQAVLEEIERGREVKLKVQEKVAELVDDFNQLRDEQRYEEMEIVARRLYEMAPDEPVAQQVWETAKFIRREIMNQQLADRREQDYWSTFHDVEQASQIEVGDEREMVFAKNWEQLVKTRRGFTDPSQRTEREMEIQRKLKTPVLLRYENTPLSQVADELSQLTGVNIHLDPQGLNQEGWNSDTPITINLNKEISLKSALNLILEPLHLSYVIKDEVLKVTSEQLRDGELEVQTYNVADLVIPIPNFVPNNNMGLQGLLNDAYSAIGYGAGGLGTPGPTVLVNNRGPGGANGGGDQLLAQQFSNPGVGAPTPNVPIGGGPGGLGGAEDADFDSLIDLIVSTVANETWAENGGGQAEIRPFPTNLSLVISQTQAVHDQIADLLQQLRKLQDLQVTIEVRFIRLNDRFFERIGIDFDVNVESSAEQNLPLSPDTPGLPSAVVGVRPAAIGDLPAFTADLEIPFRQGSFGLSSPAFGGASAAAESFGSFGFAILSDIEAYFLVQAFQGDVRSNVLNAPKVTLFNGQQAFVADAIQRPFVISVIPVVGEFAAAQQPVIIVLSEGTLMTIQAVVSDDRRYVRLTVVPFFSQVGDVDTFTFEGSSSTSSSSSTVDDPESESEEEAEEETSSGTTVQLPTFQFVSVVTTVSVPDGGTVLLGGIKRLNEGRNEFGVPLLSKLPYVNRLFKNVGIGRETDSLMMMVTPRIIIQEEEEEKLGLSPP